jgi:hypothetical protein
MYCINTHVYHVLNGMFANICTQDLPTSSWLINAISFQMVVQGQNCIHGSWLLYMIGQNHDVVQIDQHHCFVVLEPIWICETAGKTNIWKDKCKQSFLPYTACLMTITAACSVIPNLGPATTQIFSWHLALMPTFWKHKHTTTNTKM